MSAVESVEAEVRELCVEVGERIRPARHARFVDEVVKGGVRRRRWFRAAAAPPR